MREQKRLTTGQINGPPRGESAHNEDGENTHLCSFLSSLPRLVVHLSLLFLSAGGRRWGREADTGAERRIDRSSTRGGDRREGERERGRERERGGGVL